MERFPVELLYILLFAGIVLFNIFTQRAARRRQQEEQARAEAQPEAQGEAAPVEEAPLEDIWGRTPAPAPVAVAMVPVRTPPPPVAKAPPAPLRVHPVRALLRDKRDLRRAVALMMVLGPCRSEEPPER